MIGPASGFEILTANRKSQPVQNNKLIKHSQVFIEKGVRWSIVSSMLLPGQLYSKKAEVMEGCIIRGPFANG